MSCKTNASDAIVLPGEVTRSNVHVIGTEKVFGKKIKTR